MVCRNHIPAVRCSSVPHVHHRFSIALSCCLQDPARHCSTSGLLSFGSSIASLEHLFSSPLCPPPALVSLGKTLKAPQEVAELGDGNHGQEVTACRRCTTPHTPSRACLQPDKPRPRWKAVTGRCERNPSSHFIRSGPKPQGEKARSMNPAGAAVPGRDPRPPRPPSRPYSPGKAARWKPALYS